MLGHVDLEQVDESLSGTYSGWSALRKELQQIIKDTHHFVKQVARTEDEEDDDDHDEEEAELPQNGDDELLAKVRSQYDSNVKLPELCKQCLKTDVYPLDGNPPVMMRKHAILSKLPSLAYDQFTKEYVHILSLHMLTRSVCGIDLC